MLKYLRVCFLKEGRFLKEKRDRLDMVVKRIKAFFRKKSQERTRKREIEDLRKRLVKEETQLVLEGDKFNSLIGICNIEINRNGSQKDLAMKRKKEYEKRRKEIEERLRFIKTALEKGLK